MKNHSLSLNESTKWQTCKDEIIQILTFWKKKSETGERCECSSNFQKDENGRQLCIRITTKRDWMSLIKKLLTTKWNNTKKLLKVFTFSVGRSSRLGFGFVATRRHWRTDFHFYLTVRLRLSSEIITLDSWLELVSVPRFDTNTCPLSNTCPNINVSSNNLSLNTSQILNS